MDEFNGNTLRGKRESRGGLRCNRGCLREDSGCLRWNRDGYTEIRGGSRWTSGGTERFAVVSDNSLGCGGYVSRRKE